MYRNCYYVEVFLFLILHHVGWNLPSGTVFNCSRDKSRLVRMIIHKKVIPLLFQYKLSLPQTCPFHFQRDALWWPDIQDYHEGHWICPICGHRFTSEDQSVIHWDLQHAQTFFQNEDSICLADFCDIFRCEVISAALEVEKNRFIDTTYSKVHSQNKTPCDETKMLHVQKKCKIVIRQCLLGLLSSLSVKDFQDIEDEINHAICSYLTCNKYKDVSLHTVQPVPLLFSIVFGSALMGGLGLLYYAAWTLSNPFYSYHNALFLNTSTQNCSQGIKFKRPNGYRY